jgi:hypothetical protein
MSMVGEILSNEVKVQTFDAEEEGVGQVEYPWVETTFIMRGTRCKRDLGMRCLQSRDIEL